MKLWKCCTQYASKFGKLSSGHKTGKGQFSFQPLRKAMPKNAQTTTQLHSSHASEVMLTILQAGLQQVVHRELPGEAPQAEEPEVESPAPAYHRKCGSAP